MLYKYKTGIFIKFTANLKIHQSKENTYDKMSVEDRSSNFTVRKQNHLVL